MPREQLPPDGKAWLRGERVAAFKWLFNEQVRIISGPDTGSTGWIVAVDPRTEPEPIYTVEIADGDPNAEVPESAIEPVA